MRRSWFAAVALGLITCAGMSAQAGLRAIADHPETANADKVTRIAGFEAEDHFPGAALLYAERETAAPAAGTTGTIELPAIPAALAASAAYLSADIGITPAAPFSTAEASQLDRTRALDCLTTAIYYEAASEPDAGQRAVAQVILNRVRHPAFPATICGVVYQGSERAGCQFSFACDGAMRRVPAAAAWARAARVAAMALAGYVYAPIGLATHYHTYAVTPAWNRALVMTDVVGAHFFHRWKGWWGTAAAFRQHYAGGEPLPGPHVGQAVPPVQPLMPMPVVAAVAPPPGLPVTPQESVRAPYAGSGTMIASAAAAPLDNRLPAASTVLDKWKEAGKPLF